jgi:transposase-like protein
VALCKKGRHTLTPHNTYTRGNSTWCRDCRKESRAATLPYLQVVELAASGLTVAQISQQLGVSTAQFYNWKSNLPLAQKQKLAVNRVPAVNLPYEQVAQLCRSGATVAQVCKALNVTTPQLYNWRKRLAPSQQAALVFGRSTSARGPKPGSVRPALISATAKAPPLAALNLPIGRKTER